MIRKILSLGTCRLSVGNENMPRHTYSLDASDAAKIRALATGAALTASVDGSPAVLIGLYDYARQDGRSARRRTG